MISRLVLICILIIVNHSVNSQNILSGSIIDDQGKGIENVTIAVEGNQIGSSSNRNGFFEFEVKSNFPIKITFYHINFKDTTLSVSKAMSETELKVKLQSKIRYLDEIRVETNPERSQISLITLDPKSLNSNPVPGGDITGIIKTLPGVISNNEMSNSYSVRGGNYDENIILVEGIPVYRPFLITNGQQEGLSFANPDMTESISFSTGGWVPKYGGKLSSVMNLEYREVEEFELRAEAGLLGGRLYAAGNSNKLSYSLGIRRKSVGYLLNTFDTQGEYLPRFTDFQSFITYNINPTTKLNLLSYYGRNRYYVEPENRTTEFGTFTNSFRLFVGFDGSEFMNYDILQNAVKLEKKISSSWNVDLIFSNVQTGEREYRNVEGGYRLCDLDNNPSSDDFNECITLRGIGTQFNYSRNKLDANINDIWLNSTHTINLNNTVEWGLIANTITTEDIIDEYTFLDSADFTIESTKLYSENTLSHATFTGYLQHTFSLGNSAQFVYGTRVIHSNLTGETLLLPRLNINYDPAGLRRTSLNMAMGLYAQVPFYRELRQLDGTLNNNILAQKSFHLITGIKRELTLWSRPFIFSSEFYFKELWDVIAYDIDNVRVRYFADNNTIARLFGADLRFAGEFIPGTESWFSLGLLNAKEDIMNDDRGYISRPTDQTITFGAFFQDHFPNDPSMRVTMSLQFGSGLPFGPPGSINNRNVFKGDLYRRVDLGFSKDWKIKSSGLTATIEVLNLLGAENSITYTWIRDLNNNQIAIPNGLSARFFNLKLLFYL